MNRVSIITNSSASAVSNTASVIGAAGVQYQVIGFDGSANAQNFRVALRIGGKVRAIMEGTAGLTVGRHFGNIGPVAGVGSTLAVTVTPAATGLVHSNLYYRIIV